MDGASPTVPSIDLSGTGLDLHAGRPLDVHVTYHGATLAVTISDAATGASASWSSFPVDVPAAVGIFHGVGRVHGWYGRTRSGPGDRLVRLRGGRGRDDAAPSSGGTGGLAATQEILSWTFGP